MANWVYPLGSAADGSWDISLGASDSTLGVEGWAHTGLKVATLAAGAAVELPAAAEERIVIPLSGSFTAEVDGQKYRLAGRPSVFSGPSDVLYTGTGRAVSISSADGGRVAVATAPAKTAYPTRLVTAAETPVELRGAGNCSRQVHNFGTPAALEADRFIVCEVLTPAGNWSSYPPHKHDTPNPGEAVLEEIYYFEVAAEGLGYQRVYSSERGQIDTLAEVSSGDVVLVPYGYHGPSMAAPGYDLYYLNVLAGPAEQRSMAFCDDPRHAWIRSSWDDQPTDPRLPFGRTS